MGRLSYTAVTPRVSLQSDANNLSHLQSASKTSISSGKSWTKTESWTEMESWTKMESWTDRYDGDVNADNDDINFP